MSFECEPCHKVATDKNFTSAGHFALSEGPCESCKITAPCAHCQCSGKWDEARKVGKARREARGQIAEMNALVRSTQERERHRKREEAEFAKAASDLVALRQELNDS